MTSNRLIKNERPRLRTRSKFTTKTIGLLTGWKYFTFSFLRDWVDGLSKLRKHHELSVKELDTHLEDVSDRMLRRLNEKLERD